METGGRPKKWTEEVVAQEAKALIEWAKKDDSLILRQFAGERFYNPQNMYEWIHEHPVFKEAFGIAKCLVGSRRELGGLTGRFDAGIVKMTMSNYDDEHKKNMMDIRRADTESVAQRRLEYIVRGQMMDDKKRDAGTPVQS